MKKCDKYELFMVNAAHNRHGRVDFFPKEEYRRRVEAVQKRMEWDGVQAVVLFRRASYTDPNILWLTGKFESSDPTTYIVKDGRVIEVDDRPGPPVEDWPPKNYDGKKPGGPPVPPPGTPPRPTGKKGPDVSPFLQGGAADNINKHLGGLKKIAFIGVGSIDAQLRDLLSDISPGAVLLDYTEVFEEQRAVKSMLEIAAIEEAVYVQDKAFESIADIVKDGLTEQRTAAGMLGVMRRYGTDFSGGACPLSPVIHLQTFKRTNLPQRYKNDSMGKDIDWPGPHIERGDWFRADINGHGAGCYTAAKSRNVYLSQPSDLSYELFERAIEAQDAIATAIKPGKSLAGVIEGVVGYFPALSEQKNERCDYISGLGVSRREMPTLRDKKDSLFKENMVVSIRIPVEKDGFTDYCRDTFAVEKDGARLLSRLERKLIVLY